MFAIRVVAITCMIAVIISSVSAQEQTSRIVGGYISKIENTPYIVQLRYANGALLCGGTLIDSNYVVTAAHCFLDEDSNNAVVVGGVSTLTDKGVERQIVNIAIHPEYSATTMHSDVAVIKLNEPMVGDNITPIRLCSRSPIVGTPLLVSGWGQTADLGPVSHNLRSVVLPVTPVGMCRREYKSFVEKNMFCGSGYEAKGHCLGDSGGPAVVKDELCGIIAFGYKCGEVGHSSGFTDVFKVRPFIESAIAM